ncbi:hypothetical protein D3C77_690370 [compost metagenome]
MPRLLAGKARSAVFDGREGIGSGLVHRRHQGATVGKRVVAMVNGPGGKTGVVMGVAHGNSLLWFVISLCHRAA